MTLIRVVYDWDGKREEYEATAEQLAEWQQALADRTPFSDMEASEGGLAHGMGYTIRRIDIYVPGVGWPCP